MKQPIRPYHSAPPALIHAAKERDNYTCQDCGKNQDGFGSHWLKVHHIEPYRTGGEHTLVNLITLCPPCHAKRDKQHNLKMRRITRPRNGKYINVPTTTVREVLALITRNEVGDRERAIELLLKEVE